MAIRFCRMPARPTVRLDPVALLDCNRSLSQDASQRFQLHPAFQGPPLPAPKPTVAVLATLDTKGKEARFVADVLARAGAVPWIMDLSLKPHDRGGADATAASVAAAAGASWQDLGERSRQDAAGVMAEGGRRILLGRF